MKLLVSTYDTQGWRKSDFCWVPEGEILYRSLVCNTDEDNPDPDGGCGCGRSLIGTLCHKGTTTFKVSENPMDLDQFLEYCQAAAQDAKLTLIRSQVVFRSGAEFIARSVSMFDVGTVMELRNGRIQARPPDR